MEQWVDKPAMVWDENSYSYRDLLDTLEFWKKELALQKIESGQVVGLEGDFSPKACSLLLVLIQACTIIVPLTKAVGAHREEFLDTAEAQVVFSFDENDNYRVEHRKSQATNMLTRQLIEKGDPGLVLFSSGSTGKSKASLHNFKKLVEKFKPFRYRMRVINFLLFDHIGGINTLFYTLSNGGTVVTTLNRDPERICRLIEKYKIELLPTTPTFLNLLLISEAYQDYDLSSLRIISYGTEVMPDSVLNRLNQVFPKVRLLQTYGLSEVGILRSKSKSSDSLWLRVGGEGFETKVVDGILWIRAESAMMGYLNRPDPFTEDGWFITGDAVEVDGEYIRILGRKSEVINVGGEKVYPAEVENILQMMEGVQDVTVNSEANPIMGQIVKVRVKLNTDETVKEFRKRMRAFCRDKLTAYKIPQKLSIVSNDMHSQRFKKMRRV